MKINKDFILQYGLLYGVTMSGYSLISYIIGIDFMLNWFNVGFAFLLPFGLTYYIGTISRSKNGGFISWKEAFTELFLVLAAGFFVIVAFDLTCIMIYMINYVWLLYLIDRYLTIKI